MEDTIICFRDCLTFCLFGPTIDVLEPQSSYNDKDIWTFFCLSRFPFKVWIAIELQRWSRPGWTFNLETECIKILLIGLKKVAFFKKIYRKNHGMWFDTFGFSSKYFKICQLLDEMSQLYFFFLQQLLFWLPEKFSKNAKPWNQKLVKS